MSRRPLRIVAIVLLAVGHWSVRAATSYVRDWAKNPAIVERPAVTKLFGLGDIHGDYRRMLRVLAAAKLIASAPANPAKIAWTGGGATLVVTGDMIDKGPRPVDVLLSLMALQTDARRSGGEVILLAGNHEVEFLAGSDPGKAADFIEDLRRHGIAAKEVAACAGELGDFLCSLPFAARVGDWFFSHAGNTGGRSTDQLASELRTGVIRNGFASKALLAPDSLLEARLGEGKAWFDASGPSAESEHRLLSDYAAALGVEHMVQGHQHNEVKFGDGVARQSGAMFQRWGLLFLIDVGMSEGIGDSGGAILCISQRKAFALCPNGKQTELWNEAAKPDSGSAAPCAQ